MNQEAIKPAETKLSLAFCVFTSALCESVCLIWCCLSIFITVVMASKQQQAFRMYYLTGGDTHIICVAYLGEEYCTVSAREHCQGKSEVGVFVSISTTRGVMKGTYTLLNPSAPLIWNFIHFSVNHSGYRGNLQRS